MKNLTAAQTTKDVKNVCCELIGKVVDLSKRLEITGVKIDHVSSDHNELKGDMNGSSEYHDVEIQTLKNYLVIPDEFATRDEIQKVKEKVDDLEGS